MRLNVQASHDKRFSIEVPAGPETTAAELRAAVAREQGIESPDEVRLIYAGRILKNEDTVASLKLVENATLHMVRSRARAEGASSGGIAGAGAASSTPAATPAGATPASATPASATPANASSNTAANATQSAFGGMNAAFGVPGAGGMPPLEPAAMREMMDAMMANPALLSALMQSSPMYRSAPPEMQLMMQDPAFVRMALQLSMAQMQAGGAPGSPTAAPPASAPPGNEYAAMLAAMMAGAPGGAAPPAAPAAPAEPPEVRYADQLQQLADMGFFDPEENVRALAASGGNVHVAIERILQQRERQWQGM